MLVILTALFHFHVISSIQKAISSNYLYTFGDILHLTAEVLESKTTSLIPSPSHSRISSSLYINLNICNGTVISFFPVFYP